MVSTRTIISVKIMISLTKMTIIIGKIILAVDGAKRKV